MNHSRIKVKVVGTDGSCRDNKTYKNSPKTANDILERLQASGFVGDLQENTGDSLSGDDLLDDTQEYTLKLAPEGNMLCLSILLIGITDKSVVSTLENTRCNHVKFFLGVGQGRAPLLSESGKARVQKNVFLVMVNGLAVGGGFFYLPGKAVTADHNLPASHR